MRLRHVLFAGIASFVLSASFIACGGDDTVSLPPDGGADGSHDGSVGDGSSSEAGNSDGSAGDSGDSGPSSVHVQILAINDFHANLQPPAGSSGLVQAKIGDPAAGDAGTQIDAGDASVLAVPAGGAAYLATHLKTLKAGNPNTLIVSAGDATGAAPLVSALFHDEPSVLALNSMGVDINAVGNHEFDRGVAELLRLQYGGCHPESGCVDSAGFPGAAFEYLAANVEVSPGKTVFPRYVVKDVGGAKIGFVGMTLEGTPNVSTPSAVAGLTFDNEVKTVNALIPEIRGQGVSAIIVLIHQGGFPAASNTYDDCQALTGDILPIVDGLDPAVEVVVSAHTHQAYNCTIGNRIVTSAASFGRLITQLDLTLDTNAHKITSKAAKNILVSRDVTPDPDVAAIVSKYVGLSGPIASRVVGHITGPISKLPPSGESPLGDVIADAQLAATSDPKNGGAVIAFMNPGGIRADLVSDGAGGSVSYSAAFTTQPFNNTLVTMTLTGDQIHELLEEQFNVTPTRFLQVSSGFTYHYDATKPAGQRVDLTTVKLNGVALTSTGTYTVVVNNFLSTGGDGFTILKSGTNRAGGLQLDIDALVAYLTTHDPLTAPTPNRILTP